MFPALPQTTDGQSSAAPAHVGFRDEKFASAYLGVSIETLRTWRQQGSGPRFRKFGRCLRYSISDLDAFVEASPAGGGRAA